MKLQEIYKTPEFQSLDNENKTKAIGAYFIKNIGSTQEYQALSPQEKEFVHTRFYSKNVRPYEKQWSVSPTQEKPKSKLLQETELSLSKAEDRQGLLYSRELSEQGKLEAQQKTEQAVGQRQHEIYQDFKKGVFKTLGSPEQQTFAGRLANTFTQSVVGIMRGAGIAGAAGNEGFMSPTHPVNMLHQALGELTATPEEAQTQEKLNSAIGNLFKGEFSATLDDIKSIGVGNAVKEAARLFVQSAPVTAAYTMGHIYAGAGGLIGGTLAGAGSYGETKIANRGDTTMTPIAKEFDALFTGGLEGITEGIFDKFSIGKWIDIYKKSPNKAFTNLLKGTLKKNLVKQFAFDIEKSTNSEGAEEAVNTLGSYAKDYILGKKVDFSKLLPDVLTAFVNGKGAAYFQSFAGGGSVALRQHNLNLLQKNIDKMPVQEKMVRGFDVNNSAIKNRMADTIKNAIKDIQTSNFNDELYTRGVTALSQINQELSQMPTDLMDKQLQMLGLYNSYALDTALALKSDTQQATQIPTIEPPIVDETVPNVESEAITPVETTTESIPIEEPVKTKETEQPIEKPKKKSKIKTGEEIDIQFAKEELSDIKKQIKAETDENVKKRLQAKADKLTKDIIKMEMETKQEEAKPVTLEVETIKEVPKAKEVPKIEIPEKTATDKTGKSKIGLEIIEDAVSKGLIDSGESAEFVKVNKKEQAQLAHKLLNEDINKAMESAKSGVMPTGYEKLRTPALLNALREYNKKYPTGKMTIELANSTIVKKSSVEAQELGLYESQGERVLDKIVNKIDKSLEPRAKKFSKAEKKLVNKHKSEFDAEVKKRNTPSNWIKFIEAIECPT